MARALILALVVLAACGGPAAVVTPTPSASAAATSFPTPAATPSPSPSSTLGLMPIFDAHLHYSRESWTAYPPEKIAAVMDSVGVRSALVSSAPDEGTFRLKAVMGDRIVPMLGPYRNGSDVFSWTRDGTIVAYVQSAYRPGMHRGFGEFHLLVGQTGLPVVKSVLAFAAREKLFLQPHADARAVAELLGVVGADRVVLWAHAGVTATPEEIDTLLARWPNLWTELSLRDDVAPQGKLDPKWRALLTKYGDRFMVGTDTWTVGGTYTGNERWDAYTQIVRGIRGWLAQLPPDVAEAIAYGNAERFLDELPR
ncbi:MAG: amidohydrolase [Chloroflexi bacterium]|nr:MAG: amidohydrolase [Chloroflexota bacterium]